MRNFYTCIVSLSFKATPRIFSFLFPVEVICDGESHVVSCTHGESLEIKTVRHGRDSGIVGRYCSNTKFERIDNTNKTLSVPCLEDLTGLFKR